MIARGPATVRAPAKLTLSLEVVGLRADGYHDLRMEVVAVDLADELVIDPAGSGLQVKLAPPASAAGVGPDPGPDNLVHRALALVAATASVELVKRIPVGGGLGGGSSDAAAVLRWAGVTDPVLAAGIGADVPACLVGGRTLVQGIGERVTPLPFEPRTFVLLLPPFGVDTAAVFRAWDASPTHRGSGWRPAPAAHAREGGNDLTSAALEVEPRLGRWRSVLAEVSGAEPRLAGSGSTWFVEGALSSLSCPEAATDGQVADGGEVAPLVEVRTVPAEWGYPEWWLPTTAR